MKFHFRFSNLYNIFYAAEFSTKKYSMNMFQDVSELFVSIPMMVGRNV